MNEYTNYDIELNDDELEQVNGGIFIHPISPVVPIHGIIRKAKAFIDYVKNRFIR